MSSSSHTFKTPEGSPLKVVLLGSGIKTCMSHTGACVLVQEPEMGRHAPAPPLTGTGSHPPPDKLVSVECCSHFDRHL